MQTDITKDYDNKRETHSSNVNAKHILEQRPRSTGFKSFLNWFKKVENLQRNNVEETSSLSDSCEDDSSASSTATVASFAFLPANVYKPYGDACQPEKFIASGPYTETYHRLITERNRRRNLDKNLSLRKKYSLYSSGTLGHRIDAIRQPNQNDGENVVQAYDTFSLPAFAKKGNYDLEGKDNRKTASLSSKDSKSGISCHVKGKRKAPQPPTNNNMEFTRTYRKKRQAPPPPKQTFYTSHISAVVEENIHTPREHQFGNQSQVAEKKKIFQLDMEKTKNVIGPQSELSPKPWYKRQGMENKTKNKSDKNNSSKKKNKHEYPEVGFFRCSRLFENKKSVNGDKNMEIENKQEKRSSCLLPNISELDREAAEIIKHHKKNLEHLSKNTNSNQGGENLFNKPSSARELINKFNALTNAADSDKIDSKKQFEVFPIGNLTKQCDTRDVSIEECIARNQYKGGKSCKPMENNITEIRCKKCRLVINTGDKCINCIDVHLNQVHNLNQENRITKKDLDNTESMQSFQAEVFSAIANFNFSENKILLSTNDVKSKETISNETNKEAKLTEAEEKYKLRELLKEMKNSLPKRQKPVKSQNAALNVEINGDSSESNIVPDNENVQKGTANDLTTITPISKSKIVIEIGPVIPTPSLMLAKKDSAESNKQKIEGNTANKVKDIQTNIERAPTRDYTSNKVSSSAQTSYIVKKVDLNNKPNTDALPEPAKLDSQLIDASAKKDAPKAIDNTSNALYINVQESGLAFPKPQITHDDPNRNANNTKLLLKQLESAIADGNDLLAAKLAKDLAVLKVNCSVTSTSTIQAKEINVKSIKIYIEDQFSHQGPISLRIKENISIVDLKIRVFEELHIPPGIQRWIIGKQLATDDKLPLAFYNGNSFDTPLFLYVVAPDVKTDKPIEQIAADAKKSDRVSDNVVATGKLAKVEIKSQENPIKVIPSNSKLSDKVEEAVQGPSRVITPAVLKDVTKKTWICTACTLINSLLSPLCSACGSRKHAAENTEKELEIKPVEKKEHYLQLVNLDSTDIVLNTKAFECPVCLTDCKPNDGVTLRECLHSFCKECLVNLVKFSEEAEIKCPYRDKEYFCDCTIQEREIKSLVDKPLYERHLAKSVNFAENKIKNTFHCKSADCKGWCIFEENVNDFRCPVCKKTNCLTCQAIHEGKNCKEYQESVNSGESNASADGQRTKKMLDDMVAKGEAMACPSCQVVLMKKWGCDWLRCSMCKTEICWVTRGPRWGPAGKGDASAGCQCGVNGVKCHPKCNYCH